MLLFEKNGQGVWDFDFEAIEKITSKEFVRHLKFEYECPDPIKDVKVQEFLTYFCIHLKTNIQIVSICYNRATHEVITQAIGIMAVEMFYKEVK